MSKINLDFFFANSPTGEGKTYSTKKIICPFCQEEFSSWKKEGLDHYCWECRGTGKMEAIKHEKSNY